MTKYARGWSSPGPRPPPTHRRMPNCPSAGPQFYPACQSTVAYSSCRNHAQLANHTRAPTDNAKATLQAMPKHVMVFMRAPAHRVSIPQPQKYFPLSFSWIHISGDLDVGILGICWQSGSRPAGSALPVRSGAVNITKLIKSAFIRRHRVCQECL
jgi:hypothetical protein